MNASRLPVSMSLFAVLCTLCILACVPALCVSLQPGWPQSTGGAVSSSPALGDLDGDGDLEIVVGSSDDKVYAWHADGTLVTGWPQTTGGYAGTPALGDIDGDGDPEVVVGSYDAYVYAWHSDGTPVAGWPQWVRDHADTPALGDLDGDGDLEVVAGTVGAGYVSAWHGDGTRVVGWPRQIYAMGGALPALGDIAGDGRPEVVAGGWFVSAWYGDGANVAGWPQTQGAFNCPGLGDLDGDGDLEVVVPATYSITYAWHGDGSPVRGWPRPTGGGGLALGDLDGDGGLEVAIGSSDHYVYVWRGDGRPVRSWPQRTGGAIASSPALADLDGDGDLEVVVGSTDAKVYAWHGDATPVAGWPQAAASALRSSPAIGDLDGDGSLEVVAGAQDGKVYVWTCEIPTTDPLPWPTFHHDTQRTACYGQAALARGRIIGQVRDASTKAPIPGAAVEAYLAGQLRASVLTDVNGEYTIPGLLAGVYSVTVRKQGYGSQTKTGVEVTVGHSTDVSFDLVEWGHIVGQVREAGTTANLSGATVTAYLNGDVAATANPNNRGIYTMDVPVSSAEYVVTAAAYGYDAQTKARITVTLGDTTYVNFWLDRLTRLRGYVRDSVTGARIIGAVVRVYDGGVMRAEATTYAPYGNYQFGSELPAGTYTVIAAKDGYASRSQAGVGVSASQTAYCNLSLDPLEATRLKGQVRDRVTGAPLVGAAVRVYEGQTLRGETLTLAPYGVYRFGPSLPAGTYTVVASKPGYQSQSRRLIVVTEAETTCCNFNLAP
jgi:hypothetical protein